MKSIAVTMSCIVALVFLSGCETTTSRPYSASTENVLKFQSVLKDSGQKVVLGDFKENPELGSLTCRLMGPVDIAPGKSKSDYIKEAMQTELFMAQAYAIDAEIKLEGSLDALKFASISPASWEIEFSISSNKSEGYTVVTKYPFKTSYSAYSACKNVADAFGPAVQQLIRDVIHHEKFGELFGS